MRKTGDEKLISECPPFSEGRACFCDSETCVLKRINYSGIKRKTNSVCTNNLVFLVVHKNLYTRTHNDVILLAGYFLLFFFFTILAELLSYINIHTRKYTNRIMFSFFLSLKFDFYSFRFVYGGGGLLTVQCQRSGNAICTYVMSLSVLT